MRTFEQKYETSIAPDPNAIFVNVRRDDGGIVNESGTYAELLNNFYDTFLCPDVSGVRILNLHTRNPTAISCRRWSLAAN